MPMMFKNFIQKIISTKKIKINLISRDMPYSCTENQYDINSLQRDL